MMHRHESEPGRWCGRVLGGVDALYEGVLEVVSVNV